ncbi:MAG: glutathione S-transferase family protein, partial [Deltaproteobacteria bacterium]|nr:glutathione S-transferase family protein [Deltaproteobacteria bacterium]
MLKLYSIALSPWARKARIALYEKGLTFEKISIPSKPDGTMDKPAEFLAANPRGKVPTLIDDDTVVYESSLVLEYLDEAYPETPLYPKDVKAKARCRQLVDAGDQDLGGPM